MASMLVSGKEALQANSDRHFTASWKESIVAAKCFSNTFARKQTEGGLRQDEKCDGGRKTNQTQSDDHKKNISS